MKTIGAQGGSRTRTSLPSTALRDRISVKVQNYFLGVPQLKQDLQFV